MADAMDDAAALAQDLTDDALKRHAARPRPAGRTHCANLDCLVEIHPLRQASGAQLCIDCAKDEEAEAARRSARCCR